MDARQLAVDITAICLECGEEFSFKDIEIYQLSGADGIEYIVKNKEIRKSFRYAYDAAEYFANMVWTEQNADDR